ncbi:unnamed protein product [Rhodiola kirilowii]
MPEEMKQMKEMMVQILRMQPVQVKPCEFCSSTDHKTDACPTLIVEEPAEVNAVVGYQGYNNNNSNDRAGPNRQYNQVTNPTWRNDNHPSRETQQATLQLAQSFYQPPHRQYNQNAPSAGQYQQKGQNQYPTGQYQQKGPNQYQAGPSNPQGPNKSLDDVVKELVGSMHRFQVETKGDILDLKKQMSQLATSMSALTNEPGRLPSQTIQNPRHRPDWNQEEDRPNDGRTWVTHADNGRYAFTVSMTQPPIIHLNVPASGWDDNDDLDSDGPRWDSPTNIYASEQSIYLEKQELNGPDPANLESEEDAELTDYKGSNEQAYLEDFLYSI